MKKFENFTMLVDFYELTMANGYLKNGYKDKKACFDLYFRKVPDNGGFAITAGLKQVIDYLNELHFSDEDIIYLRSKGIFCEEFLDYLKQTGHTIYLASATHFKVLSRAVEHFGLNKYFDFIITEEIVGISKRDPKIYELCMEKAGSTPKTTFLFEDANHAVKTAHNLGINVCALSDASMAEHIDEVKANSNLYIDDFCNLELLKKFIG